MVTPKGPHANQEIADQGRQMQIVRRSVNDKEPQVLRIYKPSLVFMLHNEHLHCQTAHMHFSRCKSKICKANQQMQMSRCMQNVRCPAGNKEMHCFNTLIESKIFLSTPGISMSISVSWFIKQFTKWVQGVMQGSPLRLPLSWGNRISSLMSLPLFSCYVNTGVFLRIKAITLHQVSWQEGICYQEAP